MIIVIVTIIIVVIIIIFFHSLYRLVAFSGQKIKTLNL